MQRIGVEPHSFAREKHDGERRGQALNGNGVVLQSVAMALCYSVKFGKGFDRCVQRGHDLELRSEAKAW